MTAAQQQSSALPGGGAMRRALHTLMDRIGAREERLFNTRRICLLSSLLAGVNVVLLAVVLAAGGWLFRRDGALNSIDFVFTWVSGRLAGSAEPASVYDYASFAAAQARLIGATHGGLPYSHFLYPPTFLFFTYPLAKLPYIAAFAIWVLGTFALFAAAVYAALPRLTAIVAAGTTAAVLHNVHAGQNGFLTAGLVGLSLACIERRPILSGVCLGLLTYKPQFGLLFPLALVAGGQWRVILAAAATAAVLALAAPIVLGPDIWSGFFATLRGFDGSMSPDGQLRVLHQSVFGLLYWSGIGLDMCWAAQLIASALTAAFVCLLWMRPTPFPLKAAALCVGIVATTPYVVTYDLCILSLAGAFLVRDGIDRGFCPGERIFLLAAVLTSYVFFFAKMPLSPLIYAGMLGIVALRWTNRQGAPAASAMSA